MTETFTLVLLRHGESEWNAKNLFTGWVDVPLAVDVSWFRTSEAQTHTHYDGLGEWSETWTWSGRLTGRVDGTPLDPAQEQRGLVGTWEHHEVR